MIQPILRLINIGSELKKINQAIGKSRAGLTTKIHAIADSRVMQLTLLLQEVILMMSHKQKVISSIIHKEVSILADRYYDSNIIVEYIEFESAKAVIPSQKNRKTERDYDEEVYKNRKLKQTKTETYTIENNNTRHWFARFIVN